MDQLFVYQLEVERFLSFGCNAFIVVNYVYNESIIVYCSKLQEVNQMVRRTRRTEMPKQLTEFEFVRCKINEWEQNNREVTMGTFEENVFTPYEVGDVPNAFLIGSIFEEDSRIVLREEIEKEFKFYSEQFEKRMVAIGIY